MSEGNYARHSAANLRSLAGGLNCLKSTVGSRCMIFMVGWLCMNCMICTIQNEVLELDTWGN
jgi:hypothetical protein